MHAITKEREFWDKGEVSVRIEQTLIGDRLCVPRSILPLDALVNALAHYVGNMCVALVEDNYTVLIGPVWCMLFDLNANTGAALLVPLRDARDETSSFSDVGANHSPTDRSLHIHQQCISFDLS